VTALTDGILHALAALPRPPVVVKLHATVDRPTDEHRPAGRPARPPHSSVVADRQGGGGGGGGGRRGGERLDR